jgi:phytoene dehydrogenase-like protein
MAAITLGRAGMATLLLEAESAPGGACRSAELTRPGYTHDVGAAVHLFALAAPALRSVPFEERGASFVHGAYPLAHPLDDGTAVILRRSVPETAAGLGQDGGAYERLINPLLAHMDPLLDQFLGPPLRPRHPVLAAGFAKDGLLPLTLLAGRFKEQRARALLAGVGAHSVLSLSAPSSSAIALILTATAHRYGWPVVRGGTQRLTDALVAEAKATGVVIETDRRISSLGQLPDARCRVLDVTPRQLLAIEGALLPQGYRRRLERFRYAPGAYKLDWALDGPIPWRDPECAKAVTVHVGGTLESIADAEADVARGRHPARPFLLLVQPTVVDPSRAPAGMHTAWAYCHVPNGSTVDMTERMERQIERFAPGFRDRILARSVLRPADLERIDANCVGGDIGGGLQDLRQTLARPVFSLDPYRTPVPGLFLCSASTPPGGGVHGMCGYHAARSALRYLGAARNSPR